MTHWRYQAQPTCHLQLLLILWLTDGTTITPLVSSNCCWSSDSLKVPQSPHLSPPTSADPLSHLRYHNHPTCLLQLLLILWLTEGTTITPPVSTNCCWSFAAECSGPQSETLGFVSGQWQHPILSLHLLHIILFHWFFAQKLTSSSDNSIISRLQ